MRIWDAVKIAAAIKFYLLTEEKVDVIEWLSRPKNIVLENEHGDMVLVEYGFPVPRNYSAHYFFKSRGRQAIESGKKFLDELFNTCYNIDVVIGMAPVNRRDVCWITRQLGFTSHGIEEVKGENYELFILTKKEFNHE